MYVLIDHETILNRKEPFKSSMGSHAQRDGVTTRKCYQARAGVTSIGSSPQRLRDSSDMDRAAWNMGRKVELKRSALRNLPELKDLRIPVQHNVGWEPDNQF